MKRFFLFLTIGFFLFQSCETEVDLTTDPEEIMVVYGLLNQNDTEHHLKITKTFLVEGDVTAAASDSVSLIQYGPDDLEVKLHGYRNGAIVSTYVYDTLTIFNKEPGAFYYPKQMVYKTEGTLDPTCTYKLEIKNKKTGTEASSETGILDNVSIIKPRYAPGYPLDKISFLYNVPLSKYNIEWYTVPNGYFYTITMILNYKETKIADETDVAYKSISMSLGTFVANNPQSANNFTAEKMSTSIPAEAFFQFLKNNINEDLSVKRNCIDVDFLFSAGTPELYTYMQVSQPSSGIIQDKPTYTNINNGIGLFSATGFSTSKAELSPYTINSIKAHPDTENLGFE